MKVLEKRKLNDSDEYGVFATQFIKQGQRVFDHSEWIQDEQTGWQVLSIDEIEKLFIDDKHKFLKYGYDKDFDKVIGTFNWENAVHDSNFINHNCEPNCGYDLNDNIIAVKDIEQGSELTLDYAHFIVNHDQAFTCNCGSENCRTYILKDDWKELAYSIGFQFPTFMHPKLRELFNNRLC